MLHCLASQALDMEESAFPRAHEMHANRRPKALLLLVLLLVILAVLIFVGTRFLGTGSEDNSGPTPTEEVAEVAPTSSDEPVEETPTPTPEEEELDRSSLSVQVLNGSGISGAAGELAGILEDLGYTDVTTGNADEFEYEDISISVTSTKANFLNLLETDLEDSYTIGNTDTDLVSDTYDAVIIIGE